MSIKFIAKKNFTFCGDLYKTGKTYEIHERYAYGLNDDCAVIINNQPPAPTERQGRGRGKGKDKENGKDKGKAEADAKTEAEAEAEGSPDEGIDTDHTSGEPASDSEPATAGE